MKPIIEFSWNIEIAKNSVIMLHRLTSFQVEICPHLFVSEVYFAFEMELMEFDKQSLIESSFTYFKVKVSNSNGPTSEHFWC